VKRVVIDASVIAAASLNEPLAQHAVAVLTERAAMFAPDFLYIEVANVLWKRVMKSTLRPDAAVELLGRLKQLAIALDPAERLVVDALPIAIVTGRTVYDCMYIACAEHHDAVVITGDQRLHNALRETRFAHRTRWLGAP